MSHKMQIKQKFTFRSLSDPELIPFYTPLSVAEMQIPDAMLNRNTLIEFTKAGAGMPVGNIG